MKIKSVLSFLVATVCGFFGGTFASQNATEASSPPVVRASRFELVSTTGTPIAYWGVGPGSEIHMRFLPNGERAALDIGILGDERPALIMGGRDGKDRITIKVDQGDKPVIGMSDERWKGRVLLGFIAPDFATPGWDEWGLSFCAFGSERSVANIGMSRTKGGSVEGVLAISGKKIRSSE